MGIGEWDFVGFMDVLIGMFGRGHGPAYGIFV